MGLAQSIEDRYRGRDRHEGLGLCRDGSRGRDIPRDRHRYRGRGRHGGVGIAQR